MFPVNASMPLAEPSNAVSKPNSRAKSAFKLTRYGSGSGCGVLRTGGGLQCTGDCSGYHEWVHDVTYQVTATAICRSGSPVAACNPNPTPTGS